MQIERFTTLSMCIPSTFFASFSTLFGIVSNPVAVEFFSSPIIFSTSFRLVVCKDNLLGFTGSPIHSLILFDKIVVGSVSVGGMLLIKFSILFL